MTRNLFAISVLLVLFSSIWLVAFGTGSPCQAMRERAARLSAGDDSDWGRTVQASVVKAPASSYSTYQCIGLTLNMMVTGKSAIKVVAVPK
jgi:hypothetical protein